MSQEEPNHYINYFTSGFKHDINSQLLINMLKVLGKPIKGYLIYQSDRYYYNVTKIPSQGSIIENNNRKDVYAMFVFINIEDVINYYMSSIFSITNKQSFINFFNNRIISSNNQRDLNKKKILYVEVIIDDILSRCNVDYKDQSHCFPGGGLVVYTNKAKMLSKTSVSLKRYAKSLVSIEQERGEVNRYEETEDR